MTTWLDGQWHASPVWGGKSLQVTQQFGATSLSVEPLLAGQHVHCGIDVGMVVGTPLYAARSGRVGYVGYGLLALISDQCDWYVHIDRVAPGIYAGAGVGKGALVAYSGAKVPSGGSLTGPHLHFEVQPVAAARLGYYDANGRFIVPPGALNNPATAVDPVPALSGTYGAAGGGVLQEDDMLYISKFSPKVATLRVFTPGSSYTDPSANARVVGALAIDAIVGFDGYVYSSSSVGSADLSGTAGAQPGQDFCWWHASSGQWVPDAILDTSKLAGAPSAGIPAGTAVSNYFALAGQGGSVDVNAITAAVVKALPAYATADQVKQAISDAFARASVTAALKLGA